MSKILQQTNLGPLSTKHEEIVKDILEDGGIIIDKPKALLPNLICIVDLGRFSTAYVCQMTTQLKPLLHPLDNRKKTWLLYANSNKFSN
jgi:hypothetical protein